MPALDRASGSHSVLVSDFDGTMTSIDFFERVLAHCGSQQMPDYWGQYLEGKLTHFEALQAIFRRLPADEQQLMRIARQTGLDGQLPAAVARLAAAGWAVVVVSAGCQWYIERLLAEQDVHLPVIANPGTVRPGDGLEMSLPEDSPFFCPQVGIDKRAVVAAAVRTYDRVAFAGDGPPDLAPARLVSGERRFARRWLAESLQAEGLEFRRFAHWSQIADMLLEQGDSP